METFIIKLLGFELKLISSGRREYPAGKNEISILATDGEKQDFDFDYFNTPPHLCALIVASFFAFVRGLPLDYIILNSNGKCYPCQRAGSYFYTGLSRCKILGGTCQTLGCVIEYYDIFDKRVFYAQNYERLDKSILPTVLHHGNNPQAKGLAVLHGDCKRLYLESEADISLSFFVSLGEYLLRSGMLRDKTTVIYKSDTVKYLYEDGEIKIGISPKIKKIC